MVRRGALRNLGRSRLLIAGLILAGTAATVVLLTQASVSIGRLTAGVERERLEVGSFGSADRELQRLGQALLRLSHGSDLEDVEMHRGLALQQMRTLAVEGGHPEVVAISEEVAH